MYVCMFVCIYKYISIDILHINRAHTHIHKYTYIYTVQYIHTYTQILLAVGRGQFENICNYYVLKFLDTNPRHQCTKLTPNISHTYHTSYIHKLITIHPSYIHTYIKIIRMKTLSCGSTTLPMLHVLVGW